MDELDGAGRWYEVFADFARRYGVDKTMELMAPEFPPSALETLKQRWVAGGEDPKLRLEDVLAARLRISRDLFLDVFGAGWAKQEQQNRHWPFQPDQQPWYVAGTPAQLMLQIDDGIATVARPVGRWQGVAELVYEPTGSVVLAGDPEADRKVIAGLLAARRSSFRYCPLCREQTPPELRDGGLECMSCGERWRGILH